MNNTTKKILNELEKTQKIFWNISHQTAEFISMLIKIRKPDEVLEIGTSNGYSALWIADALDYNKKGHLTTIEFYEERQSIAKSNFCTAGLEHLITPIQGPALEILKNYDKSPDIVFLDANKSQYIDYFNLTDEKLNSGSIILADNVLSHSEKVKPFVDAITRDERYQSEILDLPAGLLMALKL